VSASNFSLASFVGDPALNEDGPTGGNGTTVGPEGKEPGHGGCPAKVLLVALEGLERPNSLFARACSFAHDQPIGFEGLDAKSLRVAGGSQLQVFPIQFPGPSSSFRLIPRTGLTKRKGPVRVQMKPLSPPRGAKGKLGWTVDCRRRGIFFVRMKPCLGKV
jgi:hypothetical protein